MTNDLIVIDFLAIHNGICIRANNVIGQVGFLSCLVSQLWIDFSVIKHDSVIGTGMDYKLPESLPDLYLLLSVVIYGVAIICKSNHEFFV